MKLEGKIIVFLGDSITEGWGVEDIENNRYDNRMKKMCNLKAVYNYGIGGTRLAHQTNPSLDPAHDLCFCGRVFRLNPDADIIVVYGGVNDYMHGDAPFGEIADITPKSFCGGVEFLMSKLEELYPNAQKVFMTPAHVNSISIPDDEKPSPNPNKYSDAKPLKEYVKVIEDMGKKHNIPVLNLYDRLPINANIPEQKEKYTGDGLHFNDDGHKILAETLIDFIEKEV